MMSSWLEIAHAIEALEDVSLDLRLIDDLTQARGNSGAIHFFTPTFKHYATSELAGCGKSAWPAVSITGGECKLACDHCKAKILEPMIPARSPEALWRVVNAQIENGAQGMLLTGGSNHRNEVEYGPYYPTIRRIKDAFPAFRIAVHTALVNAGMAGCMAESGIDVAMMDVIGAQDTITQVYHLRRTVDDFERSLEFLNATPMKVVPHIVLGLHYGRLLGEWNALEIIARHKPDALVLVIAMPFYAPSERPFAALPAAEAGRFFMDARRALPDIPLLLGCARPAGVSRMAVDAYAVMAGLNGIAHPSDGIVELALRLQRDVRVMPACCSMAVGDELFALEDQRGLRVDLAEFLAHQRSRPARQIATLDKIKIVSI